MHLNLFAISQNRDQERWNPFLISPEHEPPKEQGAPHPEPGEVIYVTNDGKVMCRRWNWRNGESTKILEWTSTLAMNIDGLGEGCEPRVIRVRDQVAEMLQLFCGADVITGLLCPHRPRFSQRSAATHVLRFKSGLCRHGRGNRPTGGRHSSSTFFQTPASAKRPTRASAFACVSTH